MSHRPFVIALVGALACGGDAAPTAVSSDPPPPPPPEPVLLKDVVASSLPSPYYHFVYDATGRIDSVSFASELTRYGVSYANGRIKELQNDILVNHDRLVYAYDGSRVISVRYVDSNGATFGAVIFSYEGDKLVGVERHRLAGGQDVLDKTMAMTYWPDGNLRELTERRPAIPGFQEEATWVDHYEQYDSGLNVDAFGLLHDDFFDHLVLLPGVTLQRNNPGHLFRTGDGVNFTVNYTYSYDARGRPETKSGDLTLTNGPDAGRRFSPRTTFSYY